MRSERKKQIMTLSILIVAVLVISIGFAAFSATLKINSSATLTSNPSDFKVVFSSSENEFKTNPVKASPENMGEDATIDNTTVPTISGLMAKTRIPGDSVTYTFYIRNEGKFEAFLNSITLGGKVCVPGPGTNAEMVNNACDSIKALVNVGNITTSETKTNITGESLKPGESKQVTVTLLYDSNGARANGPFSVQFGEISMYYATTNGINEDENEILYTGVIYRNSSEMLNIGDSVNKWCMLMPGIGNTCDFGEYYASKMECETTLEESKNQVETEEEKDLLENTTCHRSTIPSVSYETNLSNISQNYYLKHEVVNDIVTASYACITYVENGIRKDTCLRGYDTLYYTSNQAILNNLVSYFNTLDYSSNHNNYKGYCTFHDSYSSCHSDSLNLFAYSDGRAHAYDGSSYCYVNSDGASYCYE